MNTSSSEKYNFLKNQIKKAIHQESIQNKIAEYANLELAKSHLTEHFMFLFKASPIDVRKILDELL